MKRKNIRIYHGTTEENLPSIFSHGLRKATWVSPHRSVAAYFAQARANHNGKTPVVIEAIIDELRISYDRHGREQGQISQCIPPSRLKKLNFLECLRK